MKALRNLMLVAVVVGIMGVRAFAGPIPIPLKDPKFHGPQKGESIVYNAFYGQSGEAYITVDWVVRWNDVMEVYEYFYQLENPTTTAIARFTLTPQGPVLAVGAIEEDIDTWLGHILPDGEVELDDLHTVAPDDFGFTYIGDVYWEWDEVPPLLSNKESYILYLTSLMPPTYGYAEAKDGTPGPFSTGHQGSQPIPVPSPEPGVLLMLGISVAGILVWRRKA